MTTKHDHRNVAQAHRTAGLCLVILALSGLFAAPAVGSVIDLRDLPNNFDQFSWGQPDTTVYAQSVVADDTFLNEFRFRAQATSGSNINFNIIITGDRADGGGGLGFAPDFSDIRFQSADLSIGSASPFTEITINPNIGVTNGERLFLVLNTFTFPSSGVGFVRATEVGAAVDPYLPGEFVFINTGGRGATILTDLDAFAWAHRGSSNEDLAILASFVPEPSTALLLLSGGLVLLRRRRRRAV